MFKSNKRGFSIIEVMCSMCILSITIAINTSMIVKSFNIKNYNDKLLDYCYFTEALKNNLIYNLEFNEFKAMEDKDLYIEEHDFKTDMLKENKLDEIIRYVTPKSKNYIKLMLSEEEDNCIISIKLYYPDERVNIRTKWQGKKEALPL